MPKIRLGIIGLGVGMRQIPEFLSHPHAELGAVCDFSEEKLQEASLQYPGVRTTKVAEDLLNDPSLQIISVASYDQFHKEQVVQALANGKHVFVEKPLCTSEEELREIRVAAQKRPDLKISSNLVLRTYPRFAELKRRIESDDLGRLYDLEADYNYGRIEKIHQGWRGQKGYSVVLGGGIHMVDLAQWLARDQIVEVSAFANRICSEGSPFEGNDMVTAIVRFSQGAVGKINANFGCTFPHLHRMAIYGTKGSYVNDIGQSGYVFSRQEPGQLELDHLPYPGSGKGALLHDFVDSIVQGRKAAISLAEIFSGMAVCFAIEKSVAEGKHMRVPAF